MTTPEANTPSPAAARDPQTSPVGYDVAQGLERHRRLVAAGAALPAWDREIPPGVLAGSGGAAKPWLWGLGGLSLLGGLLWWTATASQPQPSTSSSAVARSTPTAAQMQPLDEPGSTPAVHHRPAHDAAGELSDVRVVTAHAALTPIVEELTIAREPAPPAAPATANSQHSPAAAVVADVGNRSGKAAAPRAGRSTGQRGRGGTRDAAAHAPLPKGRNHPGAAHGEGDVHGHALADGDEVQHLVRVRELLAVAPQRALHAVREGERRFSQGYLRQERRYLEVRALLALGRRSEAQARARWFLEDFPEGAYARELSRLAVADED